MPTIQLAFSSAPQYVRTARLIGVAMARRAGVPDERLYEVRLAIGEACGRAVARHQRHGVADLVRVEMSDDGPYSVRVLDACGAEAAPPAADAGEEEAADADRMGEALLAALVDDLSVHNSPAGSEVRMVWPVRRRLSGVRGGPVG
ncbi:ATP-binding protein [Natronosporangium hydrolyticum]|uniref:ATP-binding protein n=1 Tax=Natronosporangium hydrolyticum TaxID=2811111 RepID=A0A895YAB7_9ACTN|nr:ATP-binding protein [Natronosporangium hydrolyticum]QSB14311.1 ATP-binding protein [Natronosporangium hydrolyticum]